MSVYTLFLGVSRRILSALLIIQMMALVWFARQVIYILKDIVRKYALYPMKFLDLILFMIIALMGKMNKVMKKILI